jgi:hypothetical protein
VAVVVVGMALAEQGALVVAVAVVLVIMGGRGLLGLRGTPILEAVAVAKVDGIPLVHIHQVQVVQELLFSNTQTTTL